MKELFPSIIKGSAKLHSVLFFLIRDMSFMKPFILSAFFEISFFVPLTRKENAVHKRFCAD